MLTLFYKPTCAYSQRVLAEGDLLGLTFNLRNIVEDPVAADELKEKGGKDQVPYLVDSDRNVSMYESGDIVSYLHEHYGTGVRENRFKGLRIHRSDTSCDVCE